MNVHESEKIAGILTKLGYTAAGEDESADVVVFNTCCIRDNAERKAMGHIGMLKTEKKKNPSMIVAVVGCMTQQDGAGKALREKFPFVDIVLGTSNLALLETYIPSVAASRGKFVDIDENERPEVNENESFYRTSGTNAWLNIMYGCNNFCTYCIVPYVRGRERSRTKEAIKDEFMRLVDEGYGEITLLGQVVNAFGREIPRKGDVSEFVRLLQKINDIDGIERIRFTSPHPSYFGDDLISAYSSLEKLCDYVHLPLQSGSDSMLKKMNRPYRAKKFLEIVDKLRAQSPAMSISTDVIVGYPTETWEDFLQTRSVFQKAAFDMAFIFKYSPRAGTLSAQQPDDISETEKEERNQILLGDLARQSLDFNERFVGNVEEILVEGFAKRGEGVLMGRTRNHRKVVFEAPPSLIGSMRKVKIVSATVTTLEGVLQQDSD